MKHINHKHDGDETLAGGSGLPYSMAPTDYHQLSHEESIAHYQARSKPHKAHKRAASEPVDVLRADLEMSHTEDELELHPPLDDLMKEVEIHRALTPLPASPMMKDVPLTPPQRVPYQPITSPISCTVSAPEVLDASPPRKVVINHEETTPPPPSVLQMVDVASLKNVLGQTVKCTVEAVSSAICTAARVNQAPQTDISLITTPVNRMSNNMNIVGCRLDRVTDQLENFLTTSHRSQLEVTQTMGGAATQLQAEVSSLSSEVHVLNRSINELKHQLGQHFQAMEDVNKNSAIIQQHLITALQEQASSFRGISKLFYGLIEDEKRGGQTTRMVRNILNLKDEEFERLHREAEEEMAANPNGPKFGPPIMK